jgi:predicted Zn-dependent protease
MGREAMEATPDLIVMQLEAAAIDHYQAERLDRAQDYLDKLVAMRPENVDYWSLLGVVLRRQGFLVPALKALRQAVRVDETDKNALINLGEALVEAGKVEAGVEVLRAIFDAAYIKGKPAAEQDDVVQRVGAQLAIIKTVIEGTDQAMRAEAANQGS